MANIFTKIIDRAVQRNVNKSTVSLQSHNTGFWNTIKSYFNYSFTGYSLTKFIDAYGSNPLVFEVVDKVGSTSAAIKRVAKTSNDKEIENSRILELITQEKLKEISISFLATGNAFLFLVKGIGAGEEVDVWQANRVEIFCSKHTGQITKYEYTNPWGVVKKVEGDDLKNVLQIRDTNIVSTDGVTVKWGMSKLQALWVVVCSSTEKFNAEASIFKNRGVSKMLSNNSEIPMLPDEREKQQKMLNEQLGGSGKYNGIAITTANMKAVELGMSPTDLKLLEGIVSSLRRICSAYCVSSVLFNDNDNSTYNNVSEAKTSAYNEAYIPLANKIDKEISEWLAPLLGVDEVISVDLNSIDEIKLSNNDVAQALSNLSTQAQERVLEVMTEEEARALIELGVLTSGAKLLGKKTDRDEAATT